MYNVYIFISIIITIWVFMRTVSYGLWTWQRENKLGAIMLFILAGTVLILPAYTMFYSNTIG